MWQPNNLQWWSLVIVALLIVFAWPPHDDKSLAAKFVNWAVDPWDELPVLPAQLSMEASHDPEAAYWHDMVAQHYYLLHLKGGWTRKRLELKVAGDPFDAGIERQVLTAVGVLTAFLIWRLAGRKK